MTVHGVSKDAVDASEYDSCGRFSQLHGLRYVEAPALRRREIELSGRDSENVAALSHTRFQPHYISLLGFGSQLVRFGGSRILDKISVD